MCLLLGCIEVLLDNLCVLDVLVAFTQRMHGCISLREFIGASFLNTFVLENECDDFHLKTVLAIYYTRIGLSWQFKPCYM